VRIDLHPKTLLLERTDDTSATAGVPLVMELEDVVKVVRAEGSMTVELVFKKVVDGRKKNAASRDVVLRFDSEAVASKWAAALRNGVSFAKSLIPADASPVGSPRRAFRGKRGKSTAAGAAITVIPSEEVEETGAPMPGVSPLDELDVLTPIGRGAFASVYLVRHKRTGEHLALKVVEKPSAKKEPALWRLAAEERSILQIIMEQPFLLQLHTSFQTPQRFYLVTEFASGGTLLKYLKGRVSRTHICVPIPVLRIILAELLHGLEFLHDNQIIFRDLKLENILIDGAGHLRIADFGLAKTVPSAMPRAHSFCGTRAYMSPEMVENGVYSYSTDMWSLAVVVFGLVYGTAPVSKDRINRGKYDGVVQYPAREGVPDDLMDLMVQLFERNDTTRITATEAKEHPFFAGIDYDELVDARWAGEPMPDFSQDIIDGPFLSAKPHRNKSHGGTGLGSGGGGGVDVAISESLRSNFDLDDLRDVSMSIDSVPSRGASPALGKKIFSPRTHSPSPANMMVGYEFDRDRVSPSPRGSRQGSRPGSRCATPRSAARVGGVPVHFAPDLTGAGPEPLAAPQGINASLRKEALKEKVLAMEKAAKERDQAAGIAKTPENSNLPAKSE